ncbi:MAG: tRNA-uridine aminocarboxypropyltransferase [Deltaproteobacteria bacterium]|nr:tRNA-uridine aminocarboxypropyltransferase [Deltaproteobacteria bacterium]
MRHMSLDPRCPRCFMKPALCLCAVLHARATRHHVRVIVHEIELQKSTNSGRLLPLLLQNAELVPYGNEDTPLPPAPWPTSTRPVVIFPLEGAPLLSELVDDDPRPRTLLMLDGTWHQANRLRKRFLTAHVQFARLPVDVRPSTYQLRQGHFAGSLSTLEATARALAILEGPCSGEGDVEAHLLDGFRRMVDRTLWLRGSKDGVDVYGGLPAGITRHGINSFKVSA